MISKYVNIILPGLVACLLLMAACQTSSNGTHSYARGTKMVRASSAENLLKAEGGMFRMVEVEEKSDAEISPLEAHMRARKNVHPTETKVASAYTKRYDPNGEVIHMRTLRLEPLNGVQGGVPEPIQYARADITVIPRSKPDFSGSVPTETKTASSKYPTPGRKPDMTRIASVDTARKAKKTPAKKPAKIAASRKLQTKDGLTVASVRFGEHPGKTRMVIDLTTKGGFSHKLSDENRLLAIQIPGAAWDAGLEAKILQHPLIMGYRAQSDKDGTRLSLKLKKPGRVIWSAALRPDHGKGDRLVFDLAAL